MGQRNKDGHTARPAEKPISDKTEKRVFVNARGEGTFICPACDKGVIRDLSDFTQNPSAVRLKCKCACGHVYRVLVDRRDHFRKPVNLMGRFFFKTSQGQPSQGLIKILDISLTGLRFSMNSAPLFKVGDNLTVEFTLDDGDRTLVREMGTVRRIQGETVGLSFKTADPNGKLARYLFLHGL